ncbi:kinase-like protein [Rickenella mellea]|uniref:Kinase-like protein n=1 Tax=Rickenella mellea TaxID=50990 RepID=A0A4Y7QIR2_9AGAM|nr:kinase-like protein [Rickenella mellea]
MSFRSQILAPASWVGQAAAATLRTLRAADDYDGPLDGPYVYLDTDVLNAPAESQCATGAAVQDLNRSPTKILDDTLKKLSCLDLSGKVTKEANPSKGGAYTDVSQGKLHNIAVAIRQLRANLFTEDELKKAIALELHIWSDLSHPNVLRLMGFTLDFGPPAFVTVWMTNGNVLDYLKKNRNVDRLKMIKGIAEGLGYLHSKGVIHSDVKCENILVSPEGAPLLIDFGLSRILEISQKIMTTREAGGTLRWMARELLRKGSPVSTKESDVWAFAMAGFEVLSGEPPYAQYKTGGAVVMAINNKEIPRKPEICKGSGKILWDIFVRCWEPHPHERPSMYRILHMMQSVTSEGFYMADPEPVISWVPLITPCPPDVGSTPFELYNSPDDQPQVSVVALSGGHSKTPLPVPVQSSLSFEPDPRDYPLLKPTERKSVRHEPLPSYQSKPRHHTPVPSTPSSSNHQRQRRDTSPGLEPPRRRTGQDTVTYEPTNLYDPPDTRVPADSSLLSLATVLGVAALRYYTKSRWDNDGDDDGDDEN